MPFRIILPYIVFIVFFFKGIVVFGQLGNANGSHAAGIRKVKDIVIYEDPKFYATFPSVVQMRNGTFLLAFRRAPERRNYGEPGYNHIDPNSYLVAVRSEDGITWTAEPELIYAHPFGGSQDPCLLKLSDGTLLCTSYGWAPVREEALDSLKKPFFYAGGAVFLGGYVLRSEDDGKSWQGPIDPPHIPNEINHDVFRNPLPAYNRGALFEGKDGRVFWVVAATDSNSPWKTSNYLLMSDDKGLTWSYAATVARDDKVAFNEASIYETPKGDLVVFHRTANLDDYTCITRSSDGGRTFGKWENMGFKGHPLQALKLPDDRVLLVYGYRHKPYGIRARVLNAECTDFMTAPEIILREDGGSVDIGYPWSVQIDNKHVLVTYYLNHNNGTRFIAGTLLEID
ncbi:hypothetical protein GCM10007415_00700 [Parapedobacter pyrenivorans]|uniref:Sialidase domain-containing protein n=1 Tax=Parapedobacter pyrenivorans TaxID=1305674 RepID=A0A917HB37_9SPHI|nr:sialidase family protein [Parapedobacter pyrenivorans]GGG73190.1 hypothetical protein GCM10007415_00700 [Parapedobacter pyrenivorans]